VGLIIEERLSESPLVERIWRSTSDSINTFISIASFEWDFVVWKQHGRTHVNIQGPETQASQTPVPAYAEFFGIVFRPGVFMPHLPVSALVNNNISLPDATGSSFWLNSEVWQLPTYDNADVFVDRLLRKDVLTREPVVASVLRGHQPDISLRSIQRRFLHAAGLNYRTMAQIERARRATLLLRQGMPILDTVYELGYFDQAHLTKSLKYFIGQTPTQLLPIARSEQLSLLYKTDAFD
jgi:hypothetical protein